MIRGFRVSINWTPLSAGCFRGEMLPRSESREERRLEGESTGLKTRHYTDGRPRKAVPTKTSKPGGVEPPQQGNHAVGEAKRDSSLALGMTDRGGCQGLAEKHGLKTRHYTDGRPRKAVPTKTSKPGGVKPPLQKNREMCRGRSIPRSADCARNDAVTTRTRCCAHGAQLAASLQ